MAFSYGFFNSKNLDRTYTAENFCDYLGSLICNGIQDNYGSCFDLTAANSGLKVILGTGKAWIDGHYFINDSSYSVDLTEFQDESLPRYVAVAIVLDTSENARNIAVEITAGTPAENPSLPLFERTETRTRLLLYGIRLNVGAKNLTNFDWFDYRDDSNVCGYCRCILGKCRVSEILDSLGDFNDTVGELNKKIMGLQAKIEELEKFSGTTGVILASAGKCGENAYFALFSDGSLKINGVGETYDYSTENRSPFRENPAIKNITVADGITKIGKDIFMDTFNAENVILPETLAEIGLGAFMQSDGKVGNVYGVKNINIPENVTKIGGSAFWGSAIETLKIPKNVSEIGKYCCRDCINLTDVKIMGTVIGENMFSGCIKLKNLDISANLTAIESYAFTYCSSLEKIHFRGTISQWQAVKKYSNWDGHRGNDVSQSALATIECSDGFMRYIAEKSAWKVRKND